MAIVFNMIGGEARTGLRSLIVVTAPTGSTVTCDGTAGTESSGKWTFPVELGTHTIVLSKDGNTRTKSVNVDTVGQYNVSMSFATYLYDQGDLCTSTTGGWTKVGSTEVSPIFNTDNMELKTTSSTSASARPVNLIDMTNYSSISFKCRLVSRAYLSAKYWGVLLCFRDASENATIVFEDGNYNVITSDYVTLTYDISSITGEQHVDLGTHLASGIDFLVTEIYIE